MRVIYVDDEELLLENFRLTARELSRIDTLHTFNSGKAALFVGKRKSGGCCFS